MPSHPILIRGGRVLIDNARVEAASLLIEGGTITALLPPDTTPDAAEIIDAADRLVVPGLVNAHTHSHGALGRGGVADDDILETFLARVPALNGGRRLSELELCARLSAAELIRKGCTACLDLCVELPGPTVEGIHAVAAAYDAAGMRAVVAPMISDRTIYQALPGLLDAFPEGLRARVAALQLPPWEETLATCRAAVRHWPFPDRVRPGIGPAIPLHCSDTFLTACAQLATAEGLPLQTHLAETRTQQVAALARYGERLTMRLDRLGVLGSRFSGAHGVWLDDTEIMLLAASGGAIAHNPMSNLRIGSGIAPVARMLASGVRVGIGTDASNTSDGQNMFEALRLATTLSRVQGDGWIAAAEAWRMATEESAGLLGFDRVGRIAPGWAADILFLDLGYCHYTPLRAPLEQLVLAENGAALRDVMIDGRFVMRDGQLLTLDEAALRRDAEAAAARIDTANAEARALSIAAAAVIRGFCRGGCSAQTPQLQETP